MLLVRIRAGLNDTTPDITDDATVGRLPKYNEGTDNLAWRAAGTLHKQSRFEHRYDCTSCVASGNGFGAVGTADDVASAVGGDVVVSGASCVCACRGGGGVWLSVDDESTATLLTLPSACLLVCSCMSHIGLDCLGRLRHDLHDSR